MPRVRRTHRTHIILTTYYRVDDFWFQSSSCAQKQLPTHRISSQSVPPLDRDGSSSLPHTTTMLPTIQENRSRNRSSLVPKTGLPSIHQQANKSRACSRQPPSLRTVRYFSPLRNASISPTHSSNLVGLFLFLVSLAPSREKPCMCVILTQDSRKTKLSIRPTSRSCTLL